MPAINLDALMRAAGASLGDAQVGLIGNAPHAPTRMAIAEATMDMMVTVEGTKGEALQVAAVNAALARTGTVNAEALSRVTMRFVAMSDPLGAAAPALTPTPTPPPSGGTAPPRRPLTRAEMQTQMLKLPDVAPVLAAGKEVQLDFTVISADRTLVRALSDQGEILAVRLLDGMK
jgi:hypothetical protein